MGARGYQSLHRATQAPNAGFARAAAPALQRPEAGHSVVIVTRTSNAANRTAAERKAAALVARRAAQIEQRERALRGLITQFYPATGQAAKTRAAADERAARLIADAEARAAALRERAEKDAAESEQEARTAVRAMLELGESRTAVAQLTESTVAQVRAWQQPEAHASRSGLTPESQAGRRPGKPTCAR